MSYNSDEKTKVRISFSINGYLSSVDLEFSWWNKQDIVSWPSIPPSMILSSKE